MGNKKMVHLDEIDIAKGLGILLVIVGHLLSEDSCVRQIIYSFHMPLFMILSGMVINDRKENKLADNIKKEKKLISAYLFWSVFYIIFDIFIRYIILRMIDIEKIIVDIYQTCILYGINVLWFIPTLFIAKIIAKYVNYISNDCTYRKAALTVLLFSSALFLRAKFVKSYEEVKGPFAYAVYFPQIAVLRSIAMAGFVVLGTCFKSFFQYVRGYFIGIKILIGGGYCIISCIG